MRSIIQIMNKLRFLYLFALSVLASSQLSGPQGNCLGYCTSCDPFSLTKCKGQAPCPWGFYDPKSNGNCEILPSYSLLLEELGQRAHMASVPSLKGWGGEAKLQQCEYFSFSQKKIIDVLGLFEGSQSIQKQFEVPPGASKLQISFSLVRDEWLPLNDFLMIEIADDSGTIQMFEISYQTRASIKSKEVNISCGTQHLTLQKYTITLNTAIKKDQIRIVLSSFLYKAVWGLTNIKIITGCSAYTELNNRTGKCSVCDSGSYLVNMFDGFGVCKSCPSLCKTCRDQNTCLECIWGSLQEGKCVASSGYKTQTIAMTGEPSECKGNTMNMNEFSGKITFPTIRNEHNNLYDEMLLVMNIYYDPFAIKSQARATIAVNGYPIMNVTLNLSLGFTDSCDLFKSGRVAKIRVIGQPLPINDNALTITVTAEGVKQIGVSNVTIYSINKQNKEDSKVNAQQTQTEQSKITLAKQTSAQELPVSVKQNVRASGVKIQTLEESVQVENSQVAHPMKLSTAEAGATPAPFARSQLKFDSQSPALSHKHSFSTSKSGLLQLSIRDISASITGMLIIQIDKLSPVDYDLVENYYSDEDLIVLVRVLKGFSDGTVRVKEMKGRRLQSGLMQIVAQIPVDRFDSYSQDDLDDIDTFSSVFTFFAWMGLITIVLSIVSGFGIIAEDFVITLQTLYLHVFVGYDLLPLSFREVIGGLRGIGFLSYFSTSSVQKGIAMNPQSQFWLFPGDFNFASAMSPILLTLLLYSLWFGFIVCLKKWVFPRSIPDESRSFLHKLADSIVCRIINYIDSIWRYQLIAILLISTMEFVSIHNNEVSGSLTWVLIVVVANLVWLVFAEVYIRNQYYENEYSYFIYQFEDRYFCKIPLHSLPSRHHRLGYPLMRVSKALLFVVTVTLTPVASIAALVLISLNTFELWYVYFNSIYSQSKMLIFKAIENFLFLCIQLIMLVLILAGGSLSSGVFIGWGWIMSVGGLCLIANGMVRGGCVMRMKYIQLKGIAFEEVDIDQKKLQTERAV